MPAYFGLLAIQTGAAIALIWTTFPVFRSMSAHLGQVAQLSPWVDVAAASSALVLHCAYWTRYRHVPIAVPIHNALIGHIVVFIGRASFFFGSAFFSLIFFRHIPEIVSFPSLSQAFFRGAGLIWVLFALFCYSLELDRLGRAIEAPAHPKPKPAPKNQPERSSAEASGGR